MKFRKQPVEVNAWPFIGSGSFFAVEIDGLTRQFTVFKDPGGRFLNIETPEGNRRADPGDWIIQGIKGEFYPCKPDIFAATHEFA